MYSDNIAVHIFKNVNMNNSRSRTFRVMSAIMMYCQYLKPLEVKLGIRGRGP